MDAFKCSRCLSFQSLKLRTLMNHIYSVHSQECNFHIKCLINDCQLSFNKYNSLYKHILKHHPEEYDGQNSSVSLQQNDVENDVENNLSDGVSDLESNNNEIIHDDVDAMLADATGDGHDDDDMMPHHSDHDDDINQSFDDSDTQLDNEQEVKIHFLINVRKFTTLSDRIFMCAMWCVVMSYIDCGWCVVFIFFN